MKNWSHILLLLATLFAVNCGSPHIADKDLHDGSSDNPYDSYSDDCIPTVTCISSGSSLCGTIIDDCGNEVVCGSCILPYVCGGKGIPNKCGNPCEDNVCTTPNQTICQSKEDGVHCLCDPGYEMDSAGNCQKLPTVTIRLMTSNLTSGDGQTYKGPGLRILKGLKPDIVFMQEFKYVKNNDSDYGFDSITAMVEGIFGPEFTFHRGSGTIPNGIISRYPIKAKGQWIQAEYLNRQFEYAVIDIPGPIDLWAVSVHLLTDKSKRGDEAEALAKYIAANVPKGDYVAIGGDFNTTSRSEDVYVALRKVVTVKGEYPDDQSGNEHTNADRSKTYDGIYVNSALNSKETAVVVGDTEHESGLVFDSRRFKPLSAVSPVKKDDSGAEQMQHMAVIRDFRIW